MRLAEVSERRCGLVWFGTIHCSNAACWMEFPIVDGVPVLTADPVTYIANTRHQILMRDDLPASLESMIGDACGQGCDFDTTRHHVGLYARSHFADWRDGDGERPCIAVALSSGLDALGDVGAGLAIDLGGSVGRGGWELAACCDGPVLVADLNFAMLRLGSRLMLEGEVTFPCRRVGIVYDRVSVSLPEEMASDRLDFWLTDVMRMPLRPGAATLATAINLIDCVPGPTDLLKETARLLAPSGGCIVTTPYDWQVSATDPALWFGGHSQRAEAGGAAEPILRATMAHVGLAPVAEAADLPWRLTLHDRSVMHYSLHMIAARRQP